MATYTVAAHRARIDAVASRAAGVQDLQLQADLARYLCVLIAGLLEQASRHIYGEYATRKAHPNVSRYVERDLESFMNPKAERLRQLAGDFNAAWRTDLEMFLGTERKDAVDSVVANRHLIAHGRDVGLTYTRIMGYYKHVVDVVEYLEAQCA